MSVGLERRIAKRPRTEGINLRRQVAITANGLGEVDRADDEGRRRGVRPQVRRSAGPKVRGAGGRSRRGFGDPRREELSRGLIDRVRILSPAVVQFEDVALVDALKIVLRERHAVWLPVIPVCRKCTRGGNL